MSWRTIKVSDGKCTPITLTSHAVDGQTDYYVLPVGYTILFPRSQNRNEPMPVVSPPRPSRAALTQALTEATTPLTVRSALNNLFASDDDTEVEPEPEPVRPLRLRGPSPTHLQRQRIVNNVWLDKKRKRTSPPRAKPQKKAAAPPPPVEDDEVVEVFECLYCYEYFPKCELEFCPTAHCTWRMCKRDHTHYYSSSNKKCPNCRL